MNKEEATAFVVQQLGKHKSRNEIIVQLCQQMSINWPDAERFVQQVELENSRKIAVKQSPALIVVGIFTLIVGIVALINGGLFFLDYMRRDVVLQALTASSLYYKGGLVVFGLAMISGSLIGIWKSMAAFWPE
jgi:hypothetical protein